MPCQERWAGSTNANHESQAASPDTSRGMSVNVLEIGRVKGFEPASLSPGKTKDMTHYRLLANAPEDDVCRLAALVLQAYPREQVKILQGPRQGLVMVRMRETVANSLFNSGEVLVTEVRLELKEEFGYGMVIGSSSRRAIAVALVDAALRLEEEVAARLRSELVAMEQQIAEKNRQEQLLSLATRVEFERM